MAHLTLNDLENTEIIHRERKFSHKYFGFHILIAIHFAKKNKSSRLSIRNKAGINVLEYNGCVFLKS